MGKFIDWNKKIATSFLEKFSLDRPPIFKKYYEEVLDKINDDYLIYDIGGGKNCRYVESIKKKNVRVYAVDISEKELESNSLVSGKIVSDVCKEIPTPFGKVDMITSSSVLEHLENNDQFFKNASQVLKSGGYFIHIFPSRYALFAIINRVLPDRIAKKILFTFRPETKGTHGFKAYYNDTYATAIQRLLEKNDFELISMNGRYMQCGYYSFFLPLFFLNYFWDWFTKKTKRLNLASYILFVARKK